MVLAKNASFDRNPDSSTRADVHDRHLLAVVSTLFDDKSPLQPSRGLGSGPREDG